MFTKGVEGQMKRLFSLRCPMGCMGRGQGDERTELLVVGGQLTLALQHLDLHLRLVVGGRAEHLALLGGDRRIPARQSHPLSVNKAQRESSSI